MRILTVLSKCVSAEAALAALLSLSGCSSGNGTDASKHEGSDKPVATAGASGKAEVAADTDGTPASPRLGGNVASVGDYQVELVVHENGLVRGLVFDAQGKPYPEHEELELAVTLNTPGGTRPRLALAWNGAASCFEGRTTAELVAAPIAISLGVAGSAHAGTLSDYALLPDAQFGGNLLATGAYGVELVTKPDRVTAFVFDAAGAPEVQGDLQVRLKLGTTAGKSLDLKWDPALKAYTAKLDAALDLGAPLALELGRGGTLQVGAAPSLRALEKANVTVRAQVAADAKLDVAVPDVNAKLHAGTKTLARAKGKLDSGIHSASKAKVKAKAAVRVPKPSAKLDVKASSKASTKTGASAGVKASAGFGLGIK